MFTRLTSPLGNPNWAPFIVRVTLGMYYIVLGIWGLQDAQVYRSAIESYAGSSSSGVAIFALLSPYLLLTCGVLLVAGFLTIFASAASALLMALLLAWAGAFPLVGEGIPSYIAKRSMVKDLVVFGANISILFSGPGILSLDRLFQLLYKK